MVITIFELYYLWLLTQEKQSTNNMNMRAFFRAFFLVERHDFSFNPKANEKRIFKYTGKNAGKNICKNMKRTIFCDNR